MGRRLLALVLVLALLGVAAAPALARPVRAHLKTLVLVSELFLPSPLRPLSLFAGPPRQERLLLPSAAGPIVTDLFLPASSPPPERWPALILAMGVRTAEEDRPLMVRFATLLSQLGYVVCWPRLEPLERSESQLERPATFLTVFRFLEQRPEVDPERISLLGISVGASIALVAASDPAIAERVRLVFSFAGYYDIFDYLEALASGVSRLDGRTERWSGEGAVGLAREVLENMGAPEAARILAEPDSARERLAALPPAERAALAAVSPSAVITGVRAPVLILHDRGDHLVHFFESEKLERALRPRGQVELVIVDLFQHVQPRQATDPATLAELARLYRLLVTALAETSSPPARPPAAAPIRAGAVR